MNNTPALNQNNYQITVLNHDFKINKTVAHIAAGAAIASLATLGANYYSPTFASDLKLICEYDLENIVNKNETADVLKALACDSIKAITLIVATPILILASGAMGIAAGALGMAVIGAAILASGAMAIAVGAFGIAVSAAAILATGAMILAVGACLTAPVLIPVLAIKCFSYLRNARAQD